MKKIVFIVLEGNNMNVFVYIQYNCDIHYTYYIDITYILLGVTE